MNPNGTFTWTTNLDTLIYSGISITGLSNYSDSSYIVNLSNSTSILVNDSGQIIPSNLPLGNFSVTTFSNYIIRHSDYFEKVDSSLTPIWQIPAFTDVTILDLTTNQSGSIFISGKKILATVKCLLQLMILPEIIYGQRAMVVISMMPVNVF
ncbi:MAG: hypothetical protein IPI10_06840 [Bacteroidetes bacterium]|nr:hypothetical protein [Bacteroidota bacterium]